MPEVAGVPASRPATPGIRASAPCQSAVWRSLHPLPPYFPYQSSEIAPVLAYRRFDVRSGTPHNGPAGWQPVQRPEARDPPDRMMPHHRGQKLQGNLERRDPFAPAHAPRSLFSVQPLAGRGRSNTGSPYYDLAQDSLSSDCHPVGVDAGDAHPKPNLDSESPQPLHRRVRKPLRERSEDPLTSINHHNPRRRRIDSSKLPSERGSHEDQQIAMLRRAFFCLGCSNAWRILLRMATASARLFSPGRMAQIRRGRSSWVLRRWPKSAQLAKDHRSVGLLAENASNRRADLARSEDRSRNLIEEAAGKDDGWNSR